MQGALRFSFQHHAGLMFFRVSFFFPPFLFPSTEKAIKVVEESLVDHSFAVRRSAFLLVSREFSPCCTCRRIRRQRASVRRGTVLFPAPRPPIPSFSATVESIGNRSRPSAPPGTSFRFLRALQSPLRRGDSDAFTRLTLLWGLPASSSFNFLRLETNL